MKTATAMLAAMIIGPAAHAHDFWIEPQSYTPDAPGQLAMDILTGHGEDTADWPLAPHRVIGLRSLGPDGLVSHATGAGSLQGDVAPELASEGLHMLFIETTNSFSALPAEDFNDYIEEEGVLPISAHRLQNDLEAAEGRELYSRRGKALVKVGCDGAGDDTVWSQPLGLTLEVIPGTNPFDWDAGEAFPVSVQFHGAAAASATLHVTQLDGDGGFTIKTGADGKADLSEALSEGRWLVHTVWAEAAPGLLNEADYQTVFSSFTFETADSCS